MKAAKSISGRWVSCGCDVGKTVTVNFRSRADSHHAFDFDDECERTHQKQQESGMCGKPGGPYHPKEGHSLGGSTLWPYL